MTALKEEVSGGVSRDVIFGLVQGLVGVILAGIAVLLLWSSWARWTSTWAIDRINRAHLAGDYAAAREAALTARETAPGLAQTELPAADLSQAKDIARIEKLLRSSTSNDRQAIHAALGLGAVLAGKPISSDVPKADAALLQAVAKGTGVVPKPVSGEPPHRAIQVVCLPRILADAWKKRDFPQVQAAAGGLLLAMPNHPERDGLILLLSAAAGANDKEIARLTGAIKDPDLLLRAGAAGKAIAAWRAEQIAAEAEKAAAAAAKAEAAAAKAEAAKAGGRP
ncbi:hypothetical protein LBMAG53_39950 [Planctomycetota bacterium]|nr:hypothetical protein LBMAG53_39950 [Planctomycetota bacterium]